MVPTVVSTWLVVISYNVEVGKTKYVADTLGYRLKLFPWQQMNKKTRKMMPQQPYRPIINIQQSNGN